MSKLDPKRGESFRKMERHAYWEIPRRPKQVTRHVVGRLFASRDVLYVEGRRPGPEKNCTLAAWQFWVQDAKRVRP